MKQPTGRIAKAIRCFGGGGGGASVPSLSSEIGQTTRGFQHDVVPAFNQFTQNEPLINQISQFGSQAAGAISPYILSILQNPYSVPPELLNQATQAARGAFQARGNVFGNQAIAGELLNRENVRQQRLQSALGMAGQTEQLLGYPESVRTGSFATLMNPLYGLAAAQLGAQTQADIASQASSASGKSSGIGLAGSVVGAAATAY